MCGGGPDIDYTYQNFQMAEAQRARREEEARQARIKEGLAQIAAVFEGGDYNPGQAAYDFALNSGSELGGLAEIFTDPRRFGGALSNPWISQWAEDPAGAVKKAAVQRAAPAGGGIIGRIFGGGGGGWRPSIPIWSNDRGGGGLRLNGWDPNAPLLRALNGGRDLGWAFNGQTYDTEEEAQAARDAMYADMTLGEGRSYEGMNPILAQRRAAMEGYYLPQLEKQYSDARDEMAYALSRSGLHQSTAAGEKQADLSDRFALAAGDIESKIDADAARTRSNIQNQRNAIESALRASGDASAAANQALQSAVTFRQDMPELNPLANIFAGMADTVGTLFNSRENERIRRLATPAPLSSGASSGRVVG